MEFTVHVYHHFEQNPHDPLLTEILSRVKVVQGQGVQLMTKADDISAKLDEIDGETNEIAADIDNLIAGGLSGLTDAQAQAVIDRLTAHSDKLKTIAAKS